MYKKFLKTSIILLFVSLLFSMGCREVVYDITGEWDFDIAMNDGNTMSDTYSFVGSIQAGDVYYKGQRLGTYSVMDRDINFTITYYDEDNDYTVETFSGYFDDQYSMSGTYTLFIDGYGTFAGNWTAQ